jgi:hypothetical protein
MSVTHVQVLTGTNQKLKDLKKKLQNEDETKYVSSQDDVINYLLDCYERNAGGEAGQKRDRGGKQKEKAKNDKIDSAPLSYDKMESSDKAMVFFTGLKKEPREWVFQELKKAVSFFLCFFSFFSLSLKEAICIVSVMKNGMIY